MTQQQTPFLEIRRYRAFPGRRADLVELMDERIIPFMRAQGMEVTGSYTDAEDTDVYVWIRRFAGEQDRRERYAAVYEHSRWTQELAPAVFAVMDVEAAVITKVIPTRR